MRRKSCPRASKAARSIVPLVWIPYGFSRTTGIASSVSRAFACRNVQGCVDLVDNAPPLLGSIGGLRLVKPFSGTMIRELFAAVAAATASDMNINERVRVELSLVTFGARRTRCHVNAVSHP